MRFRQRGLAQQVDAADFDATFIFFGAVRQQAAGEHLQRGRFSRAIVPEQAQHFATPQFQRHVMDNHVVAEAARQVVCGKGYFGKDVWQNLVAIMVVNLVEYNLLYTPTSKAVLL